MTRDEEIIVSVRLMCYNHEPYVKQAIESVLMQVVNCRYELVIGDDFSTDSTLEIINEYIVNYPQTVRLLERKRGDSYDKNREKYGRLYNFYDILQNCRGKYVAILDGDDYWTDPFKLQKQIEFLERNENVSLCFTNINTICGKGNIISQNFMKLTQDHIFNQNKLLCKISPSTCSVLFRRGLVPVKFPKEFFKSPNGDIFLYTMLTINYQAAYLNFTSASYRIHDNGVWSNISKENKIYNYLETRRKILESGIVNEPDKLKNLISYNIGNLINIYYKSYGKFRFFIKTCSTISIFFFFLTWDFRMNILKRVFKWIIKH